MSQNDFSFICLSLLRNGTWSMGYGITHFFPKCSEELLLKISHKSMEAPQWDLMAEVPERSLCSGRKRHSGRAESTKGWPAAQLGASTQQPRVSTGSGRAATALCVFMTS